MAIGSSSLFSAVSANYNTAIGYEALYNVTVDGSTAVGYQAAKSNVVGTCNTAVGYQALY